MSYHGKEKFLTIYLETFDVLEINSKQFYFEYCDRAVQGGGHLGPCSMEFDS